MRRRQQTPPELLSAGQSVCSGASNCCVFAAALARWAPGNQVWSDKQLPVHVGCQVHGGEGRGNF